MLQGIGLGLRRQFTDELLALGPAASGVDFLEVTPENWVFHGGLRRKLFEACLEKFPTVSHSVSLSVGGLDPLDEPLLRETKWLVDRARSPWWSDHLCYSSVRGAPLHDLLPLPFTEEAIRNAAARAKECEERVGAPLVLENATFYSHMPGGEMDELRFLVEFFRESGCGMLLDINNVWVNAQNHGGDARAFIDQLPMDRVRQLHVAGHTRRGDTIIDTHIGPVIDPVWELYRYALQRAGRMVPTLVEWDQEIPELPVLLAEVARARSEAKAAGVLLWSPKLADFFATVAPYLEGRAPHAQAVQALWGDPALAPERDAARLQLYARFCRIHRFEAVDAVYSVTRAVIVARAGLPVWETLVEGYFQKHPMHHVELNENGDALAPFIKDSLNANAQKLPAWIAELAEFEWWEWRTLIAPNDPRDEQPEEGPLRLASTVELRQFQHDLCSFLDDDQRESDPDYLARSEPAREDCIVLFWRDGELRLQRDNASDEELQVLKLVHENKLVPEGAAETLADLREAQIILGNKP